MGERRRRKSLWDQEDETTKNVSGVNEPNSLTGKDRHSHHEFFASETFAEVKSEEPSWKSTEEIPVAPMHGNFNSKQNAPEGKEMGGGSADYQNMSPGFDGTEQHKYNQDLGNGRNDSRRHMERGRSRSRSRSRTRGRSRSRSLSRGRRRGWSRSRSRSSSRSDGSARGKNRSRSPIGDYRRQPYGWGDKRGAPDKSSQVCREFAAGKCRRGSQCRFLHPKSVHSGNSDPLGDNTGKTCKDFIKGKCRWGDTCRFSHHSGSDGNSQKSSRYTSLNKDIDLQRDKNGKKPAGHSSGNENKSWGIPECPVNSAKLVTPDADVKQGERIVQEDFSIKAQQQPQNNLATSFASNVLNEVENSRDATQSSLISGQHSNQNGENLFPGHSSTLNETGNGQNQQNQLYHNPTNAFSGNFNGPEVHQLEKPKFSGFVSNPLTNEHSAQPTSSTVPSMFPNQTFMNKEPLKNEGPFSMDLTLPLHLVEAANNLQFNQDGVSHEPNGLVASAPAINEDGNHMALGNDGNEPGNSGALDRHGKVEEKSGTKDDKTMRIFKNSLIEFVKDLLKPTWKEGKMSREVHKTIVKKVVEKVTGTIQADHIPKTQEKVDQYLSYSKPKIAKLVQAYVERCLKADAKS